jgi:hypothetical protein
MLVPLLRATFVVRSHRQCATFSSLAYRLASANELSRVEFRVKMRLLYDYILPVYIQFFGHDHRHRSFYILPALWVRRHNRDHAIGPDFQIAIQLGPLVGVSYFRCRCQCQCVHPIKTDHQSAPGKRGGLQKVSSADGRFLMCHFLFVTDLRLDSFLRRWRKETPSFILTLSPGCSHEENIYIFFFCTCMSLPNGCW